MGAATTPKNWWSISSRLVLILFAIALVIFGIYDTITDFRLEGITADFFAELAFVLISLHYIAINFYRIALHKKTIRSLQTENFKLGTDYSALKERTRLLRNNYRQEIQLQFSKWSLTASETSIGFLLLRGFAFQQIAGLLNKSERTVRTQAISIYEKSGLGSRSEFAGFFMEALFEMEDEESFFD
ncbi:MAG: hypothetical protein KDK39_10075 [Leptospiraceae bacterium]|nr:hypothetical protein [Leptospiraceae bacterium]